jgi:two-component system, NarL family, nitrate/nitrite response regulator NarL
MKEQSNLISIVVADDHPAVLHGVAEILRSTSDMTVCAACNNGAEALEAIQKWTPTVAVLDVNMPGLNGIEVLASIPSNPTKVVFLTATATDTQILGAIAGGAKGIVLKDAALTELISCLRAVAEGGDWFPRELVDAAFERETGRRSMGLRLANSITNREREIIVMVAEGLSNKEVANRLSISEGTVKIHLHNAYQKIGVTNRTALAALAITHRDLLTSKTSDQ